METSKYEPAMREAFRTRRLVLWSRQADYVDAEGNHYTLGHGLTW